MEIIEAQKQRISRFGLQDLPTSTTDHENSDTPEALGKYYAQICNTSFYFYYGAKYIYIYIYDRVLMYNSILPYISDKQSHKKRKITGSKRIQFETCYARVSTKLDTIGKFILYSLVSSHA